MRTYFAVLAVTVAAGLSVGAAAGEPVVTQFHRGPQHLGVFDGASPGNLVKTLWTFDLGNYVVASPIVAGERLFIGTKGGVLFALDRKSGAVVWKFAADAGISATVAAADGMVFFQTVANTIYAVDQTTGREVWRRATGPTVHFASIEGFPEGTNWDYWTSSPLYDEGVVYIGSGDAKVYALDARTGAVRWSFATGSRVRSTPATDGSSIFVGSFDGVMYALDRGTGHVRWSFKTHGNAYFPVGSIQSSPVVADGLVLFGSRDFNLYALDAKTGQEVWRNLHKDSWAIATPSVRDGRVYEGSSDGKFMRCVDLKTGREIWTVPAGANIFSSAALNGDDLYVGNFDGTIGRVKIADGKHGGIILQERIYSSPWIDDGVLYFATADGVVYALTQGTMPARPG